MLAQRYPNKHVATEKRLFDFFAAIAPFAIHGVERQVAHYVFFFEPGFDSFFMMMFGMQSIPLRFDLQTPIRSIMGSHEIPELELVDLCNVRRWLRSYKLVLQVAYQKTRAWMD